MSNKSFFIELDILIGIYYRGKSYLWILLDSLGSAAIFATVAQCPNIYRNKKNFLKKTFLLKGHFLFMAILLEIYLIIIS
jgi:hypothetical protein